MKIAVLGGTGAQGAGLALRWARAGHEVLIGSRTAGKAEQAAERIKDRLHGSGTICGLDNPAAAAACQVAVLAVPYPHQLAALAEAREGLAGKLLVSVVVPLQPPHVARVWRPPAGSAAEEAQEFLGPDTPVVAALQNVSAAHLAELERPIDCDVLICGDRKSDKEIVQGLVREAGMRPVDAGPLVNAGVVEGLTAVLIGINIRYKVPGAGIRVTGLDG